MVAGRQATANPVQGILSTGDNTIAALVDGLKSDPILGTFASGLPAPPKLATMAPSLPALPGIPTPPSPSGSGSSGAGQAEIPTHRAPPSYNPFS